eukprot:ANDGO_02158.mRNA.1 hypothetical protein NAEGRDRAFT_79157
MVSEHKAVMNSGGEASGNLASTKTTTAKRIFLKNGELFAVPYPKKSRSISVPPARLETNTTYKSSFVDSSHVLHAADKMKKPLVPYKPDAIRSRLPVKFENEAVPFVRYCASTNNSQFEIRDGSNSESTRFISTNKRAYADNLGSNSVGFSNQAIVADKTRWIHRMTFK